MNRIHQIDPAQAEGKTKELLNVVQSKFGGVPNLLRVVANSPAALDAYLKLSGALAGGLLGPKLQTQIALAVAEINGCGYCLSAHSFIGGKQGLSADDLNAARHSQAVAGKDDAILKLARAVTLQRGHISDDDLHTARAAGITDAEIVEVIQHVALNILTNYTNNVAKTVVDFPEVKPGDAAVACAPKTA